MNSYHEKTLQVLLNEFSRQSGMSIHLLDPDNCDIIKSEGAQGHSLFCAKIQELVGKDTCEKDQFVRAAGSLRPGILSGGILEYCFAGKFCKSIPINTCGGSDTVLQFCPKMSNSDKEKGLKKLKKLLKSKGISLNIVEEQKWIDCFNVVEELEMVDALHVKDPLDTWIPLIKQILKAVAEGKKHADRLNEIIEKTQPRMQSIVSNGERAIKNFRKILDTLTKPEADFVNVDKKGSRTLSEASNLSDYLMNAKYAIMTNEELQKCMDNKSSALS